MKRTKILKYSVFFIICMIMFACGCGADGENPKDTVTYTESPEKDTESGNDESDMNTAQSNDNESQEEYLDIDSVSGSVSDYDKYNIASDKEVTEKITKNRTEKNSDTEKENREKNKEKSNEISVTDKPEMLDMYNTEPVPSGKPEPVEPEDAVIDTEDKHTCTITIDCKTILDNMDDFDDKKIDILPKDGIILKKTEVTYSSGESVFDVLLRETRNRRIHMEYSFTPLYNSSYIEGIANLYEYDCGNLSGWAYKVNGWLPNYGLSRYRISDGDNIEIRYTCDLGADL